MSKLANLVIGVGVGVALIWVGDKFINHIEAKEKEMWSTKWKSMADYQMSIFVDKHPQATKGEIYMKAYDLGMQYYKVITEDYPDLFNKSIDEFAKEYAGSIVTREDEK